MEERWSLSADRIKEISLEPQVKEPYRSYFVQVASFLLQNIELYQSCCATSHYRMGREENRRLYADITGESYVNSYANPAHAAAVFGTDMGRLLSFVYAEMFCLPGYACERVREELLIRMEWFVELYCICEGGCAGEKTLYEALQECCYWFISDYYDAESGRRVGEKVDPSFDFAWRLVEEADLADLDYLYEYGEYIGENERKTAAFLNEMSEEEIGRMADTYTEGYRIGFVKGNKDLSKKEVVNIIYPIGFERVVRRAIANFGAMGLRPTLMRTPHSLFHKRGTAVGGYYGSSPNRQFDYDHREDDALFLDKRLLQRKLAALRGAYARYADIAAKHAGPAWIEVFGEKSFKPEEKKEACAYDKKQQKLSVAYAVESGKIINTYIPGEERSFTIIAYPIPEIGEHYREIMRETIALNTLPYEQYERVQQVLIDALDGCESVRIKGMNGNRTDLRVELCKLKNPAGQTKFENCVADVNIPVGEVFTSPVLKGTEGVLHVKRVYLRDLSYEDLQLTFADGMVTDYSCANYEEPEANKKYIRDHILCHFDSLPMGEFAIGTNTTAYVMAKKYGIEDKLPILIAEKTGPHFAVGDTCYSHAEDVAVFNPDGKEIAARDNEISLRRKDEAQKDKAYFQCHTDITIPYDELGLLYGVTREGEEILLIREGRFVLPGTELLNEALLKFL